MTTQRQVLHIYSRPETETREIETALAELAVVCVHASDCYAAMANLVRHGPTAYEAILALLSDLTIADQEFFQLASHRYRSSAIYFYAPPGAETAARWFAQSGTCITSAELRRLFAAQPAPAEPASAPVEPPDTDRVSRLVVQEIVRPLQQAATGAPPESPPPQTTHEFQPETILSRREESAQLRRRPAGVTSDDGASPFESDIGPLLSPEELRALLGDDTDDGDEADRE